MCNMLNVVRAFEHCDAHVSVVSEPHGVRDADRLVVPGVGAFPDCMRELIARGFQDAIKGFVATGRPALGICVGMQALFEASEEFGSSAGLALIPGVVQAIPDSTATGERHRIPHIGWTHLSVPVGRQSWAGSLLQGLGDRPAVYFVHSFTAHPTNPAHRLADAWYGGRQICAAVQKDAISGVQFHPEKSGENGLKVITNFLAI